VKLPIGGSRVPELPPVPVPVVPMRPPPAPVGPDSVEPVVVHVARVSPVVLPPHAATSAATTRAK